MSTIEIATGGLFTLVLLVIVWRVWRARPHRQGPARPPQEPAGSLLDEVPITGFSLTDFGERPQAFEAASRPVVAAASGDTPSTAPAMPRPATRRLRKPRPPEASANVVDCTVHEHDVV